MVIPIGDRFNQIVHLIIKKDGKRVDRELKPTLFVPMTGRDQERGSRRQTRCRAFQEDFPQGRSARKMTTGQVASRLGERQTPRSRRDEVAKNVSHCSFWLRSRWRTRGESAGDRVAPRKS